MRTVWKKWNLEKSPADDATFMHKAFLFSARARARARCRLRHIRDGSFE